MQKKLIVVAILALGAPLAALAQSSVQLYGQATAAVTSRNNLTGSTSATALGNSQFAASLLGFRGTEDLGGGMSAVFRIETGIDIASGVAGATVAGSAKYWNRQSFVGLNISPMVTVTAGRQFHAATDRVIQTLDVYNVGGTSLAVTPLALFGVNRFVGNDSRADGSLKLRLRGPMGLTGALSATPNDAAGKSQSLDIAQVTPGYAVGAYMSNFDVPDATAVTAAVRPSHSVWGLGGNVPLGPVRLYVHYLSSELEPTAAGRITQENKILTLGAAWQATTQTTVKASYTHDKGTAMNGVNGRNGNKDTLVVSAEYALSKRTSMHAGVFTNRFTDGYKLDPVNIAALGRDPAASSTRGITLGMRHDF